MNREHLLLEINNGMQYVLASNLIQDMNQCGLNYAIVKGCPLSYYKTGKAGMRLSSDIDILISRQDIAALTKLLDANGYQPRHPLSRQERITLLSGSHQLPPYQKQEGPFISLLDVNFDLFWGEYTGKRIDVAAFLEDTVDMEIYGCRIKTLMPLKTMVHLILHHYKDLNTLYHLTGHQPIKRYFFEDVFLLCKRYPEELSVHNLYQICSKYEICSYAYYMFYYTRKVYEEPMLEAYLETLWTKEGEALLDYYGLSEQERKLWRVGFEDRLDADVSELIDKDMTDYDREKLERSRQLLIGTSPEGKEEFRSRNSPPAAGRISDILPCRRSAILAERFCFIGDEVSYETKKTLAPCRQMCYSENREGKPRDAAYPLNNVSRKPFTGQPSLFAVVAAIFYYP